MKNVKLVKFHRKIVLNVLKNQIEIFRIFVIVKMDFLNFLIHSV
jgi:hypothetical protein